MAKKIAIYPNLTVKDPTGELRAAASEINRLTSGMDDYAGGIRVAIMRTLQEMRREAAKLDKKSSNVT